jgi:hypothetical protein
VLLKVVVAEVRVGELVDRLELVGRLELVDRLALAGRRELALAARGAGLLKRRSTGFGAGWAGSALTGSALAGDGVARVVLTAGSGLAGS